MGVEQGILVAGRYRLISESGRGGRGTVWRARDEVLGRDVAVKELRLGDWMSQTERRSLCRRLLCEARATAALRHPGVVTVHDVVEDDGRPWIVMEYVEAPSLQEVIDREGRLPPLRVARIGRGVLAAVRAAHAAGILHRDVKPSNVLLPGDGRVLLTDFGLAVRTEEGAEGLPAEGSPAYVSPEQVWSRPVTEASDLWSLGATLYAAVEGHAPFGRREPLASLVAVLVDEYEPPVHAGRLRPVIDGLLRRDPADRATAAETARRLDRVVSPPRGSSLRRRPAVGLLAGMAAMILVFAGAGQGKPWRGSEPVPEATLALQSRAVFDSGTLVEHHDQAGFSLEVPDTWRRTERADGTYWHDTVGQSVLQVRRASGDPLSTLQAAERSAVAARMFPGYRRLRLESVPGQSERTAEWEFTWRGATALPGLPQMHSLHVRTRDYDLYFVTRDDLWTPGLRRLEAVRETFRPDVRAEGVSVTGRAGS